MFNNKSFKSLYVILFVFVFFCGTNSAVSFDKKAIKLYNEGMDLNFSGNTDRAIYCFKESLKIDPTFPETYKALAATYEQTGKNKKALKIYEILFEKTPSDYDLAYKIALLHAESFNKEKTVYYLKKIPPEHSRYKDARTLARSSEIVSNLKPFSEYETKNSEKTPGIKKKPKKVIIGKFTGPAGVAKDSKGNLYVADYTDNAIIQINMAGEKRVIFKGKPLNGPLGLAVDIFDNIYAANYNSGEILKISLKYNTGTVLFKNVNKPYYLTVDSSGNLFVTEQGSHILSKFKVW